MCIWIQSLKYYVIELQFTAVKFCKVVSHFIGKPVSHYQVCSCLQVFFFFYIIALNLVLIVLDEDKKNPSPQYDATIAVFSGLCAVFAYCHNYNFVSLNYCTVQGPMACGKLLAELNQKLHKLTPFTHITCIVLKCARTRHIIGVHHCAVLSAVFASY